MTDIADLIAMDGIDAALAVPSKEALLTALVDMAARASGVPATLIEERVREREALGPTGFGQGTALPHARIAGLGGVVAVMARLAQSVDYDALDGEPVDVAVLLLSPEGAGADHLKALARISRALRDPAVLARVRAASDANGVRQAFGGDLKLKAA